MLLQKAFNTANKLIEMKAFLNSNGVESNIFVKNGQTLIVEAPLYDDLALIVSYNPNKNIFNLALNNTFHNAVSERITLNEADYPQTESLFNAIFYTFVLLKQSYTDAVEDESENKDKKAVSEKSYVEKMQIELSKQTGHALADIKKGYIIVGTELVGNMTLEVIQRIDDLVDNPLVPQFKSDYEAGLQAKKDGLPLFTSEEFLDGWFILDTPQNREVFEKYMSL